MNRYLRVIAVILALVALALVAGSRVGASDASEPETPQFAITCGQGHMALAWTNPLYGGYWVVTQASGPDWFPVTDSNPLPLSVAGYAIWAPTEDAPIPAWDDIAFTSPYDPPRGDISQDWTWFDCRWLDADYPPFETPNPEDIIPLDTPAPLPDTAMR